MNMFARFDENPAMTLRVIKETKRYGRTDARTDARRDNVKTVYPYKLMKIQQWLFELLRKKHYIKSHLELQREITLIELAPSPYFFV